MGSIFRRARRVVAWLGPADETTEQALSVISAIADVLQANPFTGTFTHDSETLSDPSAVLDTMFSWTEYRRMRQPLTQLLQRSWFRRLWVRQEIGQARGVLVVIGMFSLSWPILHDAVAALSSANTKFEEALGLWKVSIKQLLSLVSRLGIHRQYSIGSLRRDVSGLECTDPRDRIYGILSLLNPTDQLLEIVPDYSPTVVELYTMITMRFTRQWKCLTLLRDCELQYRPPSQPTWIPDFSTSTWAGPNFELWSNAGCSLAAISQFTNSNTTLRAAGIYVATVVHVMNCEQIAAQPFENWVISLWQWLTETTSRPPSVDETTRVNDSGCNENEDVLAFCTVMAGGGFRHSIVPEDSRYADIEPILEGFQALIQAETKSFWQDPHWRNFRRRVEDVSRGRTLFATDQGTLGIGPSLTQPGDEVCVLLGCESSLIMRPYDDNYQLVGQSYVFNVENGNALLGPLPDPIRPVCHCATDGPSAGWFLAFQDERTGEITYDDPRWGRLGPDVETLKKDLEYANGRLPVDVEMLRNAGIDIKFFSVI
jgi:hypothetical protein